MQPAVVISTLGAEPQVITLGLDALLAQSLSIDRLYVIHTQPVHNPIKDSLARLYKEFTSQNYYQGTILFIPHQLAGDSGPLVDVTTPFEIETAFQSVYTLLRQQKQAGRTIHLCIAGGRKTLSLLTMATAQILFDANDRVWHLLSSPELIQSKSLHAYAPEQVTLVALPVASWGSFRSDNDTRAHHFMTQILTPAEREVAEHLAREGLSNAALAVRLGKSPKTVANQLSSIYEKLSNYFHLSAPPDRTTLLVLLGRSS
jgi:CRISPR-associated Csx14 family protein